MSRGVKIPRFGPAKNRKKAKICLKKEVGKEPLGEKVALETDSKDMCRVLLFQVSDNLRVFVKEGQG